MDAELERKILDRIGPMPEGQVMRIDPVKILRRHGWFSWGPDSWIHEDDLGTVVGTEDALKQEGLL